MHQLFEIIPKDAMQRNIYTRCLMAFASRIRKYTDTGSCRSGDYMTDRNSTARNICL